MKKILLVDDNEPDRVLYRRYLGRQLGHERLALCEATSGEEALALYAAERPDCVVLDNNLPDFDGIELLADLQQLARPSSPCVVMITGGGNEQLAVQALNAGALDYLVKGQFDQELLCKTVLHALEKHEWQQYENRYHAELGGINQQLRDSLHALDASRRELAEQARQLQAANQQLARTNLDLDNFVYAASHDLKQPVNNLRGLFEELRQASVSTDPDTALMWRLVDESLHTLNATITDLGTVVQEQRQPGTTRPPERVVLAEVLAEVLTTLRPQVVAAGATIEVDFASLPAVCYVPGSLRTILLNLVANALKYSQPGRPPGVVLRSRHTPGGPLLQVQDNGLGIDLVRHGQQLFQLFQRLHPEAASGTGVGLFLVNRLVQAQGGRIEVASQPGQGTLFSVYLGDSSALGVARA
ncbi:hybrid sensor histidine kinase/response regulator [Hymenobacter sp. RP-2-7]|uniref:histidine kinase n=1 Tax=Hymenobacter polaris TaxID=2682546 RepID=A0A7Y0AGA4_9BACT|nr:response regulator [Hymenobacter polaris]NML66560.1 hybrid sensor histidine kinase/response regulator [Hymenobacter polaris]